VKQQPSGLGDWWGGKEWEKLGTIKVRGGNLVFYKKPIFRGNVWKRGFLKKKELVGGKGQG